MHRDKNAAVTHIMSICEALADEEKKERPIQFPPVRSSVGIFVVSLHEEEGAARRLPGNTRGSLHANDNDRRNRTSSAGALEVPALLGMSSDETQTRRRRDADETQTRRSLELKWQQIRPLAERLKSIKLNKTPI